MLIRIRRPGRARREGDACGTARWAIGKTCGPIPSFQDILAGGIKWALGEVNADVPANLKETAPKAYTNPPYPAPASSKAN